MRKIDAVIIIGTLIVISLLLILLTPFTDGFAKSAVTWGLLCIIPGVALLGVPIKKEKPNPSPQILITILTLLIPIAFFSIPLAHLQDFKQIKEAREICSKNIYFHEGLSRWALIVEQYRKEWIHKNLLFKGEPLKPGKNIAEINGGGLNLYILEVTEPKDAIEYKGFKENYKFNFLPFNPKLDVNELNIHNNLK